ncbi:hypothetical protein SKAU_G00064200 [Synaphobranchus kaupii]|uniref:CCHC-type domain-containing protein n=1 Tax=Synaphobranchus kaupii TaxID=118154 RepID=A0A9Q1JB19_SYNKA|nr:hypothetical protein SKAU_G00064200 [Synaphobranchus kaupii]
MKSKTGKRHQQYTSLLPQTKEVSTFTTPSPLILEATQWLETIKKLKVAKARQQVYDQSRCSDEEINELVHQRVPVKEKIKHESSPFLHHSPPQAVTQPKQDDSTAALVRAFAESISASRLPVPEPTTFNGDPLRFNDWKYVGGTAKKAVESYFLLGTGSAYRAAWAILAERYGNPFLIAKAFRNKLDAWPRVSSKGSVELQELADFLRSCEAAMTQIRGLEVLNDCNENQKILAKLPDWLTSRWNRKVIEVEEQSHTFPSFSQFVKFLTREAKIACNPVTSLHALKPSESEKIKVFKSRGRGAKVLATNSDEKAVSTSCVFCEKASHSLHKCRKFMNETISERVKFVQQKKLCFGCLESGHRSKDCENRKTCNTCGKGHPTCLHDNRTKEERMSARTDGARDSNKSRERKMDCPQDNSARTSSEATSHRVIQNVKDTHNSTIIPVWVSATNEIAPQQSCDVGLLIGYNCPQALVPRQVVCGEENQPFAQRTDLGWSVVGYGNPCLDYGHVIGVSHQVIVKQVMPGLQSSSNLTNEVHYVCRTQIKEVVLPADVIKVLESDFVERASEDSTCLKRISGSCQRWRRASGSRTMVIMKCHCHSRKKDPTYQITRCAIQCLRCLERKLRRNEQYHKDYKTFVDETITRGYAERVPEKDISKAPAWYIPHHGVYHPQKPGKIRVVFDCSARFKETSLNDHLLTGPELTNSLVGVLCRFRRGPVAIMCDIERMFHQFHVKAEDQDYLRFMWWEDGDLEAQPSIY